MKIVMAGQNYRVTGGSDKVLLDEAAMLEAKGHQVAPFCADHPDNRDTPWRKFFPAGASFENPGIVDAIRYVYSSSAKRSIASLLDEFSPDVVHCHIYYGKLTASILSEVRRRDIPLVQTLHEYKIVCPVYTLTSGSGPCEECSGFRFFNVVKNRCNRGSLARSILSSVESYTSYYLGSVRAFDHFIAVSDFLRNTVIRMGVPENKITTIHNFTDVSGVKPRYESGDYYLYLGRLERNKGVWQLLEAFARAPQHKLIIVGRGQEEAEMHAYIARHNLDNVRMLGFKTGVELADIVRGSLCMIVPSVWNETFGLTITEAFGYGKPVIASRIGGIPEVVVEGEDAILVEPGNVDELLSALDVMSGNRKLASDMGYAGRCNVERKFSREVHYQKLMQVYQNLRG